MSKNIKFKYKNKEYVLEYNRESIKLMEKQGFDLDSFTKQPMTMVELAFEGSFIKNHSKTTKAEVEEIFGLFSNKKALINQLIVMIQEAYYTLWEDNEEDASKNIKWEIG